MTPSVIETWMYGNPEAIADRLIAHTKAQTKQAAKRKEIARKHKARRIRALVKQAMAGNKMKGHK